MPSKADTITEAIDNHKRLQFIYGDISSTNGSRVVYPHALYKNELGHTILDAYQVSGPSESGGKMPQWRQFDITSIRNMELREETFKKISSFNPKSDRYAKAISLLK